MRSYRSRPPPSALIPLEGHNFLYAQLFVVFVSSDTFHPTANDTMFHFSDNGWPMHCLDHCTVGLASEFFQTRRLSGRDPKTASSAMNNDKIATICTAATTRHASWLPR